MTAIDIIGGVYHEECIWPEWDQVYGSGGRAAAAISGHVHNVTLHGYCTSEVAKYFEAYTNLYQFDFRPNFIDQTISFSYVHSLSVPTIRPDGRN